VVSKYQQMNQNQKTLLETPLRACAFDWSLTSHLYPFVNTCNVRLVTHIWWILMAWILQGLILFGYHSHSPHTATAGTADTAGTAGMAPPASTASNGNVDDEWEEPPSCDLGHREITGNSTTIWGVWGVCCCPSCLTNLDVLLCLVVRTQVVDCHEYTTSQWPFVVTTLVSWSPRTWWFSQHIPY
jgi:hypothetical protein